MDYVVNVLVVGNYDCVRFLVLRSTSTTSEVMEQARHTDLVEEHCIAGEAVPEGAVEAMEERMPE